jgi:acyl carrier protein
MGVEIEETVRAFVESNFYVGELHLESEASLLDSGVVDSTGVLELIAFVESTFGIRVEDAELVPENLDSIGGLARFVSRKQFAAANVG